MRLKSSRITMSLEEYWDLHNESCSSETVRKTGLNGILSDSKMMPGCGGISVERIRPGIRMLILNLRFPSDVELTNESTENAVGFALILQGQSIQTFRGAGCRVPALSIEAGQNVAAVCRPEKFGLHIRGGKRLSLVKLEIDADELPALMDEREGEISETLQTVISASTRGRTAVRTPLSSRLRYIAYQVVNCSFSGVARRLFLEAKALEIIAEQLGSGMETDFAKRNSYSEKEINCLEHAREIIEREHGDPPTILELSRRVGLNDFRLKLGFRDLWGITIFGYVRKLRMEKARALLESGEYNVTEAAVECGYGCLGHFSAAFKKAFGVLPRLYLAESREHAPLLTPRPQPPYAGGR
ncbi:MAG: AraC family transcriptional regulator [Pseudomonadota bacterium]